VVLDDRDGVDRVDIELVESDEPADIETQPKENECGICLDSTITTVSNINNDFDCSNFLENFNIYRLKLLSIRSLTNYVCTWGLIFSSRQEEYMIKSRGMPSN
jgi:hypothetical protein